jgi:protease-4
MSDTQDPQPAPTPTPPPSPETQPPPLVIPVRYAPMPGPRYPMPPGRSVLGALARTFLVLLLALSIGLNLLLVSRFGLSLEEDSGSSLVERNLYGKSEAKDKIAVVKLEGVIMEGQTAFVQKEIDRAAADEHVKAVVFRINSPGGTITASDDLHRRIKELVDGKNRKQKGGKKPVVVSMGAIAASGGYYVAMPAEQVMAEQTTITGSIGVYAAFPNVTVLTEKIGFSMNVIKSDVMKDSGSMFHPMSAQEHELWQGMVNTAYDRFLTVVAEGRTRTLPQEASQKDQKEPTEEEKKKAIANYKQLLKAEIEETQKEIPDLDSQGKAVLVDGKPKMVKFFRKRADGGIFTAQEAKQFGLIDAIGYQEEAVKKAAALVSLQEGNYRVVGYDRPPTLFGSLFGSESGAKPVDAGKLANGAYPRLWFLAPQSDLAGLLAAVGSN